MAQDTDPQNPPPCNPWNFTSAISPDGKKVSICINGTIKQVGINALIHFMVKGGTNPNCGCGSSTAITPKKEEIVVKDNSQSKAI